MNLREYQSKNQPHKCHHEIDQDSIEVWSHLDDPEVEVGFTCKHCGCTGSIAATVYWEDYLDEK